MHTPQQELEATIKDIKSLRIVVVESIDYLAKTYPTRQYRAEAKALCSYVDDVVSWLNSPEKIESKDLRKCEIELRDLLESAILESLHKPVSFGISQAVR
jgi:hypothetical protein